MASYRERSRFKPGRGTIPEFVVDHVDSDGVEREATFDRRAEAEDFAREIQPVRAVAGDGMRAGNRAFLNRIAGRSAPEDAPQDLAGVITRISNTFTTR